MLYTGEIFWWDFLISSFDVFNHVVLVITSIARDCQDLNQ
jgi:hypothetical protein